MPTAFSASGHYISKSDFGPVPVAPKKKTPAAGVRERFERVSLAPPGKCDPAPGDRVLEQPRKRPDEFG